MMYRLYQSATAIFWLLVTAIGAASLWLQPAEKPSAIAAESLISSAELARHALPEDCWMAIRGGVHDLSAYLPEHPSRLDIVLPWCGQDATEAYETKARERPGRPHSPAADELLEKYRIGKLTADKP